MVTVVFDGFYFMLSRVQEVCFKTTNSSAESDLQ